MIKKQDTVFSLILAALRGILPKNILFFIRQNKTAQTLYPACIRKIDELSGLNKRYVFMSVLF